MRWIQEEDPKYTLISCPTTSNCTVGHSTKRIVLVKFESSTVQMPYYGRIRWQEDIQREASAPWGALSVAASSSDR